MPVFKQRHRTPTDEEINRIQMFKAMRIAFYKLLHPTVPLPPIPSDELLRQDLRAFLLDTLDPDNRWRR